MKPAVPLQQIKAALTLCGFSSRDLRSLGRNDCWTSLKYRNHQLCFLRDCANEYGNHQLTEKELGFIFGIAETVVSQALQKGYEDPKEPCAPKLLTDEEEDGLVRTFWREKLLPAL